MTSTVTFWLAGPMQAWSRERRTSGTQGRRPTNNHPTKTGVVGMVANALGRDREDPVDDLAALTFAVRADRPGELASDFHTAGGRSMPGVDGNPASMYGAAGRVRRNAKGHLVSATTPNPIITRDWFLADAVFLAALSGDDTLIAQIADALTCPARPLHLGRASYPTTGPLLNSLIPDADDPAQVLAVTALHERATTRTPTIWHDSGRGVPVHDQPVNYADRTVHWRHEAQQQYAATDVPDFDPFSPPKAPTP